MVVWPSGIATLSGSIFRIGLRRSPPSLTQKPKSPEAKVQLHDNPAGRHRRMSARRWLASHLRSLRARSRNPAAFVPVLPPRAPGHCSMHAVWERNLQPLHNAVQRLRRSPVAFTETNGNPGVVAPEERREQDCRLQEPSRAAQVDDRWSLYSRPGLRTVMEGSAGRAPRVGAGSGSRTDERGCKASFGRGLRTPPRLERNGPAPECEEWSAPGLRALRPMPSRRLV